MLKPIVIGNYVLQDMDALASEQKGQVKRWVQKHLDETNAIAAEGTEHCKMRSEVFNEEHGKRVEAFREQHKGKMPLAEINATLKQSIDALVKEQAGEFDEVVFAVLDAKRGWALSGALPLSTIRKVREERGEILCSALMTPLMPNPGSGMWFTIYELLLFEMLKTGVVIERKRGPTLRIVEWTAPHVEVRDADYLAAMGAMFDRLRARGMTVEEYPDTQTGKFFLNSRFKRMFL